MQTLNSRATPAPHAFPLQNNRFIFAFSLAIALFYAVQNHFFTHRAIETTGFFIENQQNYFCDLGILSSLALMLTGLACVWKNHKIALFSALAVFLGLAIFSENETVDVNLQHAKVAKVWRASK